MQNSNVTTRNTIRDKAKQLGYLIRFKRNAINPQLCAVGFVDPKSLCSTLGSNVFPADFYNQHRAIFSLLNEYKGYTLSDTGQRLV